jgi:hypothetical protein
VRIFTRRSYLEGTCDYRLTGDYAGKNGKYQTGPNHSRWYRQIEGVLPRARFAADIRCLSDILAKIRISNSQAPGCNRFKQKTNSKQKARVRETAPRDLNGPGDLSAWRVL